VSRHNFPLFRYKSRIIKKLLLVSGVIFSERVIVRKQFEFWGGVPPAELNVKMRNYNELPDTNKHP
jgi:hypothetical protein